MRKRARKNAVQRSITKWILLVYPQARINRSKTKQDTSSSRRARIRRRERTYPYASKTKRKLDDEMRSGFFVLLVFFFLSYGYPNRRTGEVVGTANGVFQITLVGEMEKAFVVDE